MMKTTTKFEDFFKDDPWKGIEVGSYPSSARRLYMEDERFWVSINDKGNPLFFVEESHLFDFEVLNKLNCLNIKCIQNQKSTRLVCELTEKDMFDKFRTITKDVAAHSARYEERNLFSKVLSRIYSWSEFLKPSRKGLGFRELIGFWGELFIFQKYFVPTNGFENSLIAWVGPENRKQDFTFDNQSFEVKTLLVGDNNHINISSIEQLQSITDSLYLVALRVNESLNGMGYTIENLVANCLSNVEHNEALKSEFLHKIASKLGKASEEELSREFMDINISNYAVTDSFPQLTPNNIPHKSILNAKYTIDGNSLEEYKVKKSLEDLIKHGKIN